MTWLKDPKNNTKSVTLTLLVVSFVVALIKLLMSGVTIGTTVFATFTGSDFATVVGVVGAIYWGRKFTDSKTDQTASGD
jgi:hypothetical protein